MTSASIWTLRQGDYPKGSMLIRRRVKNSVLTGKGGYVDLDGNVAVGTGWRWEIDFSDLRMILLLICIIVVAVATLENVVNALK
nr:truncated 33.6 kDa 2c protein [Tobacco rattle virus]